MSAVLEIKADSKMTVFKFMAVERSAQRHHGFREQQTNRSRMSGPLSFAAVGNLPGGPIRQLRAGALQRRTAFLHGNGDDG